MKIGYFFCGEGLGHATRTIAAGEALSKKHEVFFCSYGYAKDFVQKAGFKTFEISPEISLRGIGGSLDIKKSFIASLGHLHPQTVKEYYDLLKNEKPDLVISDSFFAPAIISKRLGIQTWMVLNQTNVEKPFVKFRSMKLFGWMVKGISDFVLQDIDKVIIPDLPPPTTICEKNLSLQKNISLKTEFIGPLVRKRAFDCNKKIQEKRVYVSIGGFGYRQIMLDKIMNVSKKMPDYNFDIVAGPNGHTGNVYGNIKWHKTVKDPFNLMGRSALLVGGGGHSTIMEAVCLGKPMISIPDTNHFEQQSNAEKLQELGIGAKVGYDTTELTLQEKIIFLSNNQQVRKKAEELSVIAIKNNGAKKLSELVDAISKDKAVNYATERIRK